MTEDELYAGITEALTLSGWRWMHIIRSDGRMTGNGAVGWPDIAAVHPTRCHLILWELKGDGGHVTTDQWAWIGPLAVISVALGVNAPTWKQGGGDAQLDARIVTPADYDAALAYIVGKAGRFIVRDQDDDRGRADAGLRAGT